MTILSQTAINARNAHTNNATVSPLTTAANQSHAIAGPRRAVLPDSVAVAQNTSAPSWGQVIDGNTPESWAKTSGLNFNIRSSVPSYTTPDGERFEVSDKKVLFRSDNNKPLAIVGNRYKVVQPSDVLSFFDGITDENVKLDVAGVAKGGRVIWASATTEGASIELLGDRVDLKILLSTACDGSQSTNACYTTYRPVCHNQFKMINANAVGMVKVRHSTEFNANDVKMKLGIDQDQITALGDMMENLAAQGMSDEQVVNYYVELYAKRDDKQNITNESQLEKIVNSCMQAYKTGAGSELITAKGTAWGALNGLTNYIDHTAPARSDENRMMSAMYGTGANVKANGIQLLQAGSMDFAGLMQNLNRVPTA